MHPALEFEKIEVALPKGSLWVREQTALELVELRELPEGSEYYYEALVRSVLDADGNRVFQSIDEAKNTSGRTAIKLREAFDTVNGYNLDDEKKAIA